MGLCSCKQQECQHQDAYVQLRHLIGQTSLLRLGVPQCAAEWMAFWCCRS